MEVEQVAELAQGVRVGLAVYLHPGFRGPIQIIPAVGCPAQADLFHVVIGVVHQVNRDWPFMVGRCHQGTRRRARVMIVFAEIGHLPAF